MKQEHYKLKLENLRNEIVRKKFTSEMKTKQGVQKQINIQVYCKRNKR